MAIDFNVKLHRPRTSDIDGPSLTELIKRRLRKERVPSDDVPLDTVETLTGSLNGSDAKARLHAALRLSEMKEATIDGSVIGQVRSVLLLSLKEEEEPLVRLDIVTALRNLVERGATNEEIINALIVQLEDYKDSDIRLAAADALGEARHPKAIEPLKRRVMYDLDLAGVDGVPYHAASALANIDSPEKISALVECLSTGDLIAKSDARKALVRINDPSVVPALLKALSNPHPSAITAVTATLINLPDKLFTERTEIVMELLKVLSSSNSLDNIATATIESGVRLGAAQGVINRLPDELLNEELSKGLSKENNLDSRLFVLRALPLTGDARAIPLLIQRYLDESEDEQVRNEAKQLWFDTKGDLELKGLIACLQKERKVVDYAQRILGAIKNPEVISRMLKWSLDKNEKPIVCSSIPIALNFIDREVLTQGLKMCSEDKDEGKKVRDLATEYEGNKVRDLAAKYLKLLGKVRKQDLAAEYLKLLSEVQE